MSKGLLRSAAAGLALLALGLPQAAKAQTCSLGSACTLSGGFYDPTNNVNNTATATFSLVTGSTTYLQVVLSNTSTFSKYHDEDVLTGFFFSIAGNPTISIGSSASSAITPSTLIHASKCTSTLACTSVGSGVNVGAEWLYAQSSSAGFSGPGKTAAYSYGVAASYSNLTPKVSSKIGSSPPSLAKSGTAEPAFGLVGSSYSNTGSGADLPSLPLVKTSITFDFALPSGISSLQISNVEFAYGIGPGRLVPEPAMAGIFAVGTIGLGMIRRRRLQGKPASQPEAVRGSAR